MQRPWLEKVAADRGGLEGCGVFEGRGLITRSARELTRLAFEHVALNRVVIRAGVENVRSRAVPERLGYTQEGIERGSGRGLGGYYDIVVYAMLANEWKLRRGLRSP